MSLRYKRKDSEAWKTTSTQKSLEEAIIIKYVEKHMNVDRLKDILDKQIKEHAERITSFTIIFCRKVNISEITSLVSH